MKHKETRGITIGLIAVLYLIGTIVLSRAAEQSQSRLSDEPIPLQLVDFPERPPLILEIGDPLLKTGPVSKGIRLPTGAVWQPSFLFWGSYRSAVQLFFDGDNKTAEWANRLDFFGQLSLTQSERILAGFRVLDDEGRFTGYRFESDTLGSGFDNEFNFNLTTLFFEGDFGELFPNLDKQDKYGLDIGFSVGRQPISFQNGLLINDNIDAFGITKVNLRPPTVVNHRATFLWAWDELNRTNLPTESNAFLYGLLNEIDWRKATVEFDVIYVDGRDTTGRGLYLGLGSTQRLGRFNTAFRVLGSVPVGKETGHNNSGVLLFAEVSKTPIGTEDLVYLNSFLGIDNFRSASRDPLVGGPLTQAGILFESVGLGRYASPLNNAADNVLGGALGYQKFFAHTRRQLILELGGRYPTENDSQKAVGVGARYQIALGQRGTARLDGFAAYADDRDRGPAEDDVKFGVRLEFIFRF